MMRKLQPQLEEINKRFANDKVGRMEATQALYKEYHVNMVTPFFALLTQFPVFTGLFFALNTVLNANSLATINKLIYPFLFHFSHLPSLELTWFTIFNTAWHISLGYPDPTHMLPLLTGLVTFAQMRIAQPMDLATTRDAMMHMTQITQFVMVLLSVGLTVFFAWHFAAGLALYRFASLVLTMCQQYFTFGWGSLWTLPNLTATTRTVTLPTQTSRKRGGGSVRRRRNKKSRK
jgi:YidC/Oxa1 family membrane protein insertase